MTAVRQILFAVGLDIERRSPAEVHALHQVKLDFCAEIFGMFFHAFNQLRSTQAIRETGIILDLVGDGHLPAQLTAGDDHRRQLRAGGIERRGQTCGTGTNDNDTFLLHLLILMVLAQNGYDECDLAQK